MTIEAALAACEATVRRADPDRYLSALFAPAEHRRLLFALYAFNHEIARIGEAAREPMAAAIRLQWWHEALESARDGRPRAHDVARGLAEIFARTGTAMELFEPLFAARQFDSGEGAFDHLADLEAYGDATAGTVMRIAAAILGNHSVDDLLFRHAGTAFALTGVLRSLPYRRGQQVRFLPRSLVDVAGPHLALAVGRIVERAEAHYRAARGTQTPRRILPALLPASLVPLYAERLLKAGDDALSVPIDVALYRRQWLMLRAALRGRV